MKFSYKEQLIRSLPASLALCKGHFGRLAVDEQYMLTKKSKIITVTDFGSPEESRFVVSQAMTHGV